jgi:Fe-S cluster assembly protein SufD
LASGTPYVPLEREALTGLSREEARKKYEALPLPNTTMEQWRFTDLRGFDPASYSSDGAESLDSATGMLDLDVDALAYVSEAGITVEQSPPEGVVFAPLGGHPRLGELVGTEDKFSAHNAAEWQHGLLVVVRPGVVLERPLYVRVSNSIDDGALFWRVLVDAGEGSQFTLIEEYASSTLDLRAYSNAAVELFVGHGAKLEYVSIQNLSRETWHFATHRARVDRDAELDWVAGGFGSRKGKITIENRLAGQGATSRVTGAYFADGDQHLDYDTLQEHEAPHTTSDFAFKGVLRDRATSVWRGMIKVERDAQRTNAYQENRNELFYCMARGLSREEAQLLIVRGFYQEIFDRIELEPVRDALQSVLEARLLAA